MLLAPATAFAASGTGEDTALNLPADGGGTKKISGASGTGSIVRTIVGLAIVLAVIYGVAWVLKQVKASKEERLRGGGLESTAVVPLGPNRALHLVRAGRELVLVGVAEQGVVPIRTYSEEEAIELGLTQPEPPAGSPRTGGTDSPTPPLVALQGRMRELLDGVRSRTVRG